MPVSRACRAVKMARSAYYRTPRDQAAHDAPVIARLNEVVGKHGRWGFWKCFHWMRLKGETWNHKRVWRVYRAMKLNLPRRAKRRLPARVKQPLNAPPQADLQWSMDFMHDTLYHGKRFRTLNVIDEGVREVLAIEVDTSLPAERVIRVLEQLKESRPLPRQIRVDNGPELVSSKLVAWCENHQVRLHHVQPGRPMQNGYVERFNKSFRNEVLDANLFGSLTEVREAVHQWMIDYNEERPHKSLRNLPPTLYRQQLTKTETKPARSSTFEMCR
jgi:putative transposase